MSDLTNTEPDRAAVERARLLYERTGVPVVVVAASLRLTPASLDRRMARWGWAKRSLRTGPAPRRARRAAGAASGTRAGRDRVATALAMERFIASEIAGLRDAAERGDDRDPERTARTVTQYARALGWVRTYLADAETDGTIHDDEPPPRSLAELRDELRRHLERIWDEGRPRGRASRARPDRA